jgi:hypothetical protein
MNQQSKFNSQQQEHAQQQASTEQTQQSSAREFATPEDLLRHDALHTPVPPTIAHRLTESIGKEPGRPQSWWRRLFGGSNP